MGSCCNKKKEKEDPEIEEDPDDRGEWANPVEFILSCLGYAVGLGNVWRFPYLAYENGGGAFLIPYAIMLTFVGIPCFMIELALGQYAGAGPLTVWTVSPLFQGIGIGMLIISFIGCIYYNMIIGWSLYYMFASFTSKLPWSHCGNDFNTELCYSKTQADDCEDDTVLFLGNKCYTQDDLNRTGNARNYTCEYEVEGKTYADQTDNENLTMPCTYKAYITERYWQRTGASEEFFNRGMLERSESIEDPGYMIWELTLVLLLAWILCYLCVVRGIKSSGKVVYFTATFPYLILVILFVRGITLEGASEGIKFYIIPKWKTLLKPKVWVDAAGQIFFSLSVGFGGLMTFASYNKFNNNIYRDTLIVAIGNCVTSFFAGFVIFSIIGHMAHVLGRKVEDVATSGSGLAFIAYPEVVTYLPVSQLWSVLFFFMLLTLGLDSQFAGIENLMTAIVDTFPSWRKRKWIVSGGLCTVLFVTGFTMCTRAGFYWLELMGYYSSGWSLVLIGLAESIVIGWVYKAKNLMKDIEDMVGFKLYMHWWVCWTFITPILLIGILAFNIYDTTPLSVGDYELEGWAQALGWLMAVVSVCMIPIVAVAVVYKSYKDPYYDDLTFGRRLLKLTQPTPDWLSAPEKKKRARDKRNALKMENPSSYNTQGVDNGLPEKGDFDNPSYMEDSDAQAATRL